MRLAELDYAADTVRRFGGLADRPWSALLDSGLRRYSGARFDILAADPFARITTRGQATEVVSRDGRRLFADDPLEVLRRELGPGAPSAENLPFAGGAIGYFSYDLGRRYERWPEIAEDDIGMPEMAVGLYDWPSSSIIRPSVRGSSGRDAIRRRSSAGTRYSPSWRPAVRGPGILSAC